MYRFVSLFLLSFLLVACNSNKNKKKLLNAFREEFNSKQIDSSKIKDIYVALGITRVEVDSYSVILYLNQKEGFLNSVKYYEVRVTDSDAFDKTSYPKAGIKVEKIDNGIYYVEESFD